MIHPGRPIQIIPGAGTDRPRRIRELSPGKVRRLPTTVTNGEYERLERDVKKWYFPETKGVNGVQMHKLRPKPVPTMLPILTRTPSTWW